MSPRWLPTHVGRRIAYLDKRVVTNTFLEDLLLCHDAGATEPSAAAMIFSLCNSLLTVREIRMKTVSQ